MAQTLEEIHALARPILVRLALVSAAPAGRIDAMPPTRGTPEHRRPPGEAYPAAEHYRDRLASTTSVTVALAIVDEARTELATTLRRRMAYDAIETADELAERIVEDGARWSPDDVALACRCTPTFVRQARLSLGRDPETGLTPPDGDPMAVAITLREAGRSLRSISRLTGIPRSTLHDRLS